MPSVVGKASRTRKILSLYRINFGYTPPYEVLCDGPTIFQSLSNDLYLKQALPKLLGAPAYPAVTECVVKELRGLGSAYSNAALFAKRVKRLPCVHEKEASVAECLVSRLRNSPDVKLILATTDPEVVLKVSRVPGVPIISIANQTKFVLKAPSDATLSSVQQAQKKKTYTLSEPDRALLDQVKSEERLQSKKRLVGRKRKLVKGPNPLSVKKSKVRSEKGSGNVKRRPSNLSELTVSLALTSGSTETHLRKDDPETKRKSTSCDPVHENTQKETDKSDTNESAKKIRPKNGCHSASVREDLDPRTMKALEGAAEESQKQSMEGSANEASCRRKGLKLDVSVKNATEDKDEKQSRPTVLPNLLHATPQRRERFSGDTIMKTKHSPAAFPNMEAVRGGDPKFDATREAKTSSTDAAQIPTTDETGFGSFNDETKKDGPDESRKKKQRKNRRRRPKKNTPTLNKPIPAQAESS